MQRRQQGATIVELAISAPVLILLGLGTVQTGLLYYAKTTLNYAVFEAARMGAVTHAQQPPMRQELGIRLAPLFGGTGDVGKAANALAKASLDVRDPRFTRLDIVNPSQQAFEDWAVYNAQTGVREIPNSHLRQRHTERNAKPGSGVNLQQANLLTIRVTYGYKMTVPLVGRLAARTLLRFDPGNAAYYLAGRLPISSVATVRMQSPARPDNNTLALATDTGSGRDPFASVAVFTPVPGVPCDEHGLPGDMDIDSLGALLQAGTTDNLCDALAGGGGVLRPGANQQPQSPTDCVPGA